ncbi:hypothetical protein [Stenotrophomonas sp. SY1]|uniref:hypothetical protein n=1 Tax=Stenotrophomonas sp. SY1 TaxID=477235 RepID=UPI001E3CF856|nr:hypothetical protein [Stenotrophomonas sp. SY1]MCD9087646.1 hypothetical protein [Stenotrophomonas sp. SY1]
MNRVSIHRRAQQLLPADIETSGLLQFGMSPGEVEDMLLDSLFGSDAHGVVVLRLAGATAVAIQRQGLAFFEQAHVARAGLPHQSPTRYGPWQQVQLENTLDWKGAAYFAAALGGQAWLAVLPIERLVVYGWLD